MEYNEPVLFPNTMEFHVDLIIDESMYTSAWEFWIALIIITRWQIRSKTLPLHSFLSIPGLSLDLFIWHLIVCHPGVSVFSFYRSLKNDFSICPDQILFILFTTIRCVSLFNYYYYILSIHITSLTRFRIHVLTPLSRFSSLPMSLIHRANTPYKHLTSFFRDTKLLFPYWTFPSLWLFFS